MNKITRKRPNYFNINYYKWHEVSFMEWPLLIRRLTLLYKNAPDGFLKRESFYDGVWEADDNDL